MLKGREVFRALRYPDYFWFWSSYFVSNVGAWMHAVAQGWLVFDLTGQPLYLGLFSLLRTVLLLFFFNVVTYFAVIAAMLRIRIPRSRPEGGPMRVGESLFDGIGYIRRHSSRPALHFRPET